MKHLYLRISLILLLATPLSLCAKEAAPIAKSSFTGKISGNKVRLRSAPHLDGSVIGELNKDDYVKVIGEQAGFFVVAPPSGMKMYVYRTYVFDQIVDANNVNVRLNPSLEAPIVAQLHAGDKVEGCKPSSQNPKWLEIDPPSTTKLYVAKEYVEKIGGEDFLQEQIAASEKASALLLASYKEAESEMKKDFAEMKLAPLMERMDKAAHSWSAMPEHKKRAEELKSLLEETQSKRKLAHLEAKAQSASEALEAKEKSALEEKLQYERRIKELEDALQNQKEQLIASLEAKAIEPAAPVLVTQAARSDEAPLSKWHMVEDALQTTWLSKNQSATSEDYQKKQQEQAIVLRGIVSPYKASTKKAPGDFVLLVNGSPAAFLYSPFIDLSVVTGKEISLTAVARDNHHFAYPAYCITQVKHGNP